MRYITSAFAIALLAAPVGCATLTRGEIETVQIRSEPSGANVLVLPSGEKAQTPVDIELRRDTAATLFIEKPGYSPTRVYLDREMDRWSLPAFLTNIILPVPILFTLTGFEVDYDSGARLHLVPNSVDVALVEKPEEAVMPEPEPPITPTATGTPAPTPTPNAAEMNEP